MMRDIRIRELYSDQIVDQIYQIFDTFEYVDGTKYANIQIGDESVRIRGSSCGCKYVLDMDYYVRLHKREDCVYENSFLVVHLGYGTDFKIIKYLMHDGVSLWINNNLSTDEYELASKFHFSNIKIGGVTDIPLLKCDSVNIDGHISNEIMAKITTNLIIFNANYPDTSLYHSTCSAVIFYGTAQECYNRNNIRDCFPCARIIAHCSIDYANIKFDRNCCIIEDDESGLEGQYLNDAIKYFSKSLSLNRFKNTKSAR